MTITNHSLPPDHPLIPVHLLIFAIQAFVTSLTCLIDVWSWPDRTTAEKTQITYLYGPYVALGEYAQQERENRDRRVGAELGCETGDICISLALALAFRNSNFFPTFVCRVASFSAKHTTHRDYSTLTSS